MKKSRSGRSSDEGKSLGKHKRHKALLRRFDVGFGLPSLTSMQSEVQDMWDVLLGRVEPPVDHGLLTLMEVADAYHSRACEMAALIHQAVRERGLPRGSNYDKFRTETLRLFIEASKRSADLGSRRITYQQLIVDSERTGRSNFMEDD